MSQRDLDVQQTYAPEPAFGSAPTILSASVSPAPVEPATWVGRAACGLSFVELLGTGGMASVYRAIHEASGSAFAVKVLHPQLAAHADVVARFRSEAAITSRVESPHVVRSLEQGTLPSGQPFIVLELLQGESLFERLRRERPSVAEAREILLQLCAALEHAHARGVIHRDLKPENVFLVSTEAGPYVKVMDFGVAKLSDAPGLTHHGMVMGTPEYMAPEQCEGAPLDGRADLYALSVIAFELTTGQKPFKARSPLHYFLAHLGEAPPSPRSLVPSLPEAWDAVIARGLAKRAVDRFPSAAEMAEAIRAALPAAGPARPHRRSLRHMVDLEAQLQLAGQQPSTARVTELSATGARVATDLEVAPGQQLRVAIPALGDGRWFEARVVHLGERAVAVAFAEEDRESRERLEAFLRASRHAPSGGRPQVLLRFHAGEERSLYDLLDLPPDASLEALARGADAIEAEFAAAAALSVDVRDLEELAAARERWRALAPAARSERARLAYDLRIGNWRGAALAQDVSSAELELLRRGYLAGRQGVDIQIALYLGRATLSESWGDLSSAVREVETALCLDPLREDLHQRRQELLARIDRG